MSRHVPVVLTSRGGEGRVPYDERIPLTDEWIGGDNVDGPVTGKLLRESALRPRAPCCNGAHRYADQRPHRARLHEVLMRVAREAGAHEDVEHIVHRRLDLIARAALPEIC